MLELPELETLRREADREIGGRKLKSVSAVDATVLGEGTTPTDLKRVEGSKVTSVVRRGSALVLVIDGGERLVVDLEAGGGLRRGKSDEPAALELVFTQGPPLRVLAGAKGGPAVHLLPEAEFAERWPAPTGIDLVEQAVSWVTFARSLVQRQGTLRSLLTNPAAVAGIGPVYADEILWQAGLRPDRRVERLGTQELRRLYRSTAEVLHDALKAGGSTALGNDFADLAGKPGGYQDLHEVVGRAGQPCRRCRGTVATEKIDGKQVYLCPQCQV